MWIKCPNGVDTLVHDPDHVKRLLNEGGVEIADPRIAQPEPEQAETAQESDERIEIESDGANEEEAVTQTLSPPEGKKQTKRGSR